MTHGPEHAGDESQRSPSQVLNQGEENSSIDSHRNSHLRKRKRDKLLQRAHPAKSGMTHAGQQLSLGNYQFEDPENKLGEKLMETLKEEQLGIEIQADRPKFVDQANDPMVRDQANDCMVRDMATDPLANDKGTDPKMKDSATDAWKRDGFMQTLKKSHQGSQQIAQEVIIIPTKEKERLKKVQEEEQKKAEEIKKQISLEKTQ